MERQQSLISVNHFRQLLQDLKAKRPDICLRYRMLGEMWTNNFVTILYINERTLLVNDEIKRRLVSITDINSIMQFEIDRPFQGFQPYFHYEVHPLIDASPVSH